MGQLIKAISYTMIGFFGVYIWSESQPDAPPPSPKTDITTKEAVPTPPKQDAPVAEPKKNSPAVTAAPSTSLAGTFLSIVTAGEYYFVQEASAADVATSRAMSECKAGVASAEARGARNIRVCDEQVLLQQPESLTDTRFRCAITMSSERHYNIVTEAVVLKGKDERSVRSLLGQQIKAMQGTPPPPLGYDFNEYCIDVSGRVEKEKLDGNSILREYNRGAYLEPRNYPDPSELPPVVEKPIVIPPPTYANGIELYALPYTESGLYPVLAKKVEAYVTSVGIRINLEKFNDGSTRYLLDGIRKQGVAYQSLVQPDQYLVQIDGNSVRRMSFDQVVSALEGPNGKLLDLVLQPKYELTLNHFVLPIVNKENWAHYSETLNGPYKHPDPLTVEQKSKRQQIMANWPPGPYMRCGAYIYENRDPEINKEVMRKAGTKIYGSSSKSPAEMSLMDKIATPESRILFTQMMNGVTDMRSVLIRSFKWGGMNTFDTKYFIPVPATAENLRIFKASGYANCQAGSNLSLQ